jgi:hypothetical protein
LTSAKAFVTEARRIDEVSAERRQDFSDQSLMGGASTG